MEALEKARELIYTGQELTKRVSYLAYLQFHVKNPALHPDDYQDPEGGYCGWYVTLMDFVLSASSLPDNFQYPCAIARAKTVIETFETFHADDEECEMQNHVLYLKDFFTDWDTKALNEAAECAMKLYLFHAAEEDDNEPINDLREISDVLTWISQFR